MFDWCRVEIQTVGETGETTVSYSHTPNEFIAEMQRRNARISVANKSCAECHYTPECAVPNDAVRDMSEKMLRLHCFPECICGAVAHRLRIPNVPDFVLCYGFYYQYWCHNKYLLAAKEAGLITFYDVAHIPTLQQAGLKTYPHYFY